MCNTGNNNQSWWAKNKGRKFVEVTTLGRCILGISDTCHAVIYGRSTLYNGVCHRCLVEYPHMVDKLTGSNYGNGWDASPYYRDGKTFRSKAQRLMDEEQERERIAKEQQRCHMAD